METWVVSKALVTQARGPEFSSQHLDEKPEDQKEHSHVTPAWRSQGQDP